MRSIVLVAALLPAALLSSLACGLACGTTKPDTPISATLPSEHTAPPLETGAEDPGSRAQPHPEIAVGDVLTAYVGPRFLTGEAFVPEARTVLADETGRVRALLRGPPPPGRYPVVKLPGALAVAGLHDAHVHITGIGQARDHVQLLGTATPAEVKARVTAWAKAHPDAAAVRGAGWDQSRFPGAAWPTWRDLEGATDKPVFLTRVDGHAGLANKALLMRAGITRDTVDPPGGRIERDATGEPTGVLIDNAMHIADKQLPGPTDADILRWLDVGLRACADAGLVAVHDMGMSVTVARALVTLDDAGALPLKVFVYLDGNDDASYTFLGTRPPSARLAFVGVKLYADGAMGSRGAALLEDYSDAAGNRGLLLTAPAELERRVAQVHTLGFAAAVHAIGDRGNRVVLDAFEKSPAPAGVRDRVEHAQLIAPEDFARFGRLGIVASMQPTHATSDMRWAEARVGAERVKGAYAWRTLLENGVMLAFGSDAPVEDERPAWGLYAAVTRQNHDGTPPEGFLPAQRVSLSQALAGFSAGAAWAVGAERHMGALTPGMAFDVTLFEDDVAAAATRALVDARIAGTLVDGTLRKAR